MYGADLRAGFSTIQCSFGGSSRPSSNSSSNNNSINDL